jgi:hypothetical protein
MNITNRLNLKPLASVFNMKSTVTIITVLIISILFYSCTAPSETPTAVPQKPLIDYFTADRTTINKGESVNLKWDISDAVEVSIEPEIGQVSSTGTCQVFPSASTKYILTASNQSGKITESILIEVTVEPESTNCMILSCDPVTGRNADISIRWEQLSLCTQYDLQIAKDSKFTLLVYDHHEYTPYSATSPGMLYLVGGIMECGHIYYIRVRCTSTATGQNIHSPWSTLGCITIKSGLPVGR